MIRKHHFFYVLLSSIVTLTALNCNATPPPPRFSGNVYASDYTVGQADVMLPLAGDTQHNLYVDPALGYGSDNQGYADLGLGYRWIKNRAVILGVYLFGGYSKIDNNARLWVANPGIEALGSRWDTHLNGYFVMGDRNVNGGVSNVSSFSGRSQIISSVQMVQTDGPGADIKLAYQLFPQTSLKAFIGSYFFAPTQDNVWGGTTGLEYWPTSYLKVFAAYNYDNLQHNTGAVGLGIELGGTHVHRSDPTLEERITDPVDRYLAELGHGAKIPSRKTYQTLSQELAGNSLVFFSQTGTPNNGGIGLTLDNCTFENPCGPTDLTDTGAATLAALIPNTVMYFNGGNYNALDVPGGTNPVTLQTGQTLSSRTADYSQAATGALRSIFNGALILPGDNTLENIILASTPATIAGNGVQMDGGSNIITVSQIGTPTNAFNTSVFIDAGSVLLQGSELNARGDSALAVLAAGSSLVKLASATVSVAGGNDDIGGAELLDTSTAHINDTVFNIESTNAPISDNLALFGVALTNGTNATVVNSKINLSATTQNQVVGLLAEDNASLAANQVTMQLNNNGTGIPSGLQTLDNATATIENTQVSVNGNIAIGLLSKNVSSVALVNTAISVTGIGSLAGISADDFASITATSPIIAVANQTPNPVSALQAIGNGSKIVVNNGVIISTGPAAAIAAVAGASVIQIHASTCVLNGAPIACP
ncbi:MAG: hypothetical protein WA659_04885 [Candidatus Aquirickettsiella sp.]